MQNAKIGFLFAIACGLSACNATDTVHSTAMTQGHNLGQLAPVVVPLVALEAADIIITDKTVVDHVADLVTGQDCSTIRESHGGNYCEEPYVNKPVAQPLYCYRSLARATCYEQPSQAPYDKLIGSQKGGPLPTQ